MLDQGMAVSFTLDILEIEGRISLMSRSQLMMTNHFVVGDFLPFRSSDVMLRVNKWITHETDVAHDTNKFVGRHGIPLVTVHLGVIHLETPSQRLFLGRRIACDDA